MIRRYKTALAAAYLFVVCSCAPPLYKEGPLVVPPAAGPDRFTVLTYNAWHGLNTGEFWVTPSELPELNQARLQFQAAQISAARPDLVFLQEVNPLPVRADEYVKALAMLGLDYDEVHQVDACGLRLHGDTALIPGLNNGLVILARHSLHLRKLEGLKLSGDLGRCDSASGMQLEELRYALIGDITLPETGEHLLVASTHLHSGFEAGAAFLETLERAYRAGYLSTYPEFRWAIDQDRLRRIGELDKLIRRLRMFRRQGAYAGFAVGGDFNFERDFPEYEEARLLRLTEAGRSADTDRILYTADPGRNGLIHIDAVPSFPAPLGQIFKNLPPDLAAKAHEVYATEIRRPRHIDYVWTESFFPAHCAQQQLFGTELNAEKMPASDHFGILTVFTRADGSCAAGQAGP